MTDSFPFLWGVATSSHQIEGHNDKNDWWAWEAQGPIAGGVRSGAATNHWKLFKEDLRLAADLGINSYRFSIEWSRLEPEEGQWDASATEWYGDLIAECEKQQLIPMLTLHHFTSPQWFSEKGGFAHRQSPAYFSKYVSHVARKLGARVPLWCTLNEPMVYTVGGYLAKFMPPAQFSPRLASRVCENLLRCHVDAYRILHTKIGLRKGPWKHHPIQVGLAHNLIDFIPERSYHPLDVTLARVFSRFYNWSWLDAVTGKNQHFGIWGLVPYAKTVKRALNHRTVDFLGINYYTKAYIRWKPSYAEKYMAVDAPIGLYHAHPQEEQSEMGWALHPKGFRRLLRRVADYGLPIIITENGIADRDDRLRPDFIRKHLLQLALAQKEGADIRGYYHWSLLDNFEWAMGFGPRFGLYAVDYDTFQRTPRPSAFLYRKMIQSQEGNSFLSEEKMKAVK